MYFLQPLIGMDLVWQETGWEKKTKENKANIFLGFKKVG